MEKEHHCSYRTGCQPYRCNCLKNHESCAAHCGCADYRNLLNGVDVVNPSVCAIQDIEAYKALTVKELVTSYDLLCGRASVLLEALLDAYQCPECRQRYWYPFLLGQCNAR